MNDVLIIETDVSGGLGEFGKRYTNHQQRVLKVNYNEYINELQACKSINRLSYFSKYFGVSMPRNAEMVTLEWDSKRAYCMFKRYDKVVFEKYVTVIGKVD